jgi:hypothetical protein
MATNQDKETAAQTASTGDEGRSSQSRPSPAGTTITVPSLQSLPGVADAFEPKHLLWFGGLAAAGAIGVLEWPVVAAVGIGTYVAERFARSARR